jgi:hypothetical protein
MNTVSTRKTERIIVGALAFFAILYVAQGVIYWLRLNQIDARKVQLEQIGETCDKINCTAEWSFVAEERFVLLGHILRTHQLIDQRNQSEVIPVSKVRGTVADSWATLRVYTVEPGVRYTLRATKYKTIKMGYFIGILPRTTSHQGILSIPDVGPTISTISGLALAFLLMTLFGACALGGVSGATAENKGLLKNLAVAAAFSALSAFLSLGILDTLLPEGDVRNKVLRISALIGLTLTSLSSLKSLSGKRSQVFLPATIIVVGTLVLSFWSFFRGGATWAVVMGSLSVAGSFALFRFGFRLSAFIWSFAIVDSLKIFGLLTFADYPIFYFVNASIFVSLAHVAGKLGGYQTISLAGVAYRRFKRDLILRKIQETLEISASPDSIVRITELQGILPEISHLTGAAKVTITVSLPLGRPVTQSYDKRRGDVLVFDDGKIPGAVTLRCLVYGDQAMFEVFDDFALRVKIPQERGPSNSGHFCAVPLRVNQSIVGTLMLTGFDDQEIQRKKKQNARTFMAEERETIMLLAERLSQSLSKLIVSDLDAMTKISKTLQTSIRQSIAASDSGEDFLRLFAQSISTVSGLGVMIHEQLGDHGIALTHAGLSQEAWDFFRSHPFNLLPSERPAYGPTVVAFRDGKASYVKDIGEIADKMHPKTVAITNAMGAMSVLAVPLKTLQRSFVVTLFSWRDQGPADPGMLSVLEATEALFVAAIEVMSQKLSVMALGRLASRLIGDDEVRGKILDAAKDSSLPTIVGSPRSSFLLLFDLVGSSSLGGDTEEKARSYGRYYDAVNEMCQKVLGGKIRKTIGDAVIVTWDGTGRSISDQATLVADLKDVAHYADEIARSIGCKGARAILHFGQYFFGLVGTQTFGQIDVIGSGIDEVCKIEGRMKSVRIDKQTLLLAVSKIAAENLSEDARTEIVRTGKNIPNPEDQRDGKLELFAYVNPVPAGGRHVA